MEFEELLKKLTGQLIDGLFINGTISQPRMKSDELKRVRLKPVELRGALHIQFEYQYERVLEHENIALEDVEQNWKNCLIASDKFTRNLQMKKFTSKFLKSLK